MTSQYMEDIVKQARISGAKATIVTLCISGLLAGLGAWLYIDSREEPDFCRQLLRHERVSTALGAEHESGLSCAELGVAIERATTGARPGQQSLAQAQAMKDVLVAMDDVIGEDPAPLDQQLTGPVSVALTSYAEDISAILVPGDVEYVRHALPSYEAWKDSEGAHMSVSRDALVRIMTSLSVDPEAYANLRDAVTRQVTQKFATAPRSKSEDALSPYPSITAWALGSMDAVAHAAREETGEDKRDSWEEKVLTRLSSGTTAPVPSFEDDPAGHLVASWKGTLPSDSPDDLLEVLEAQSTELVRVWTTALGTSSTVQASLVDDARDRAWSAQRSTLRDLRG
ncbi:hypothetical protein [Streptomyces sp. CB02400]|uniref:hypothetical protein n=1 Tax=Streptomyces sp. CB02400 TaxID=1703944 RepID=UPI001F36B3E3|nr:hypothetical protein [Streptomyces sp. CB02400]